ncbi:N-acetyltransferase 9-like protein isoform X1 [Limulus polyphemus]|uniref:N-acetyltransferase 9-like protein isoform X1 n=2 Tax=Limulus polyphemus TaxID=6850 RepID=A0ABM1C5A8_LIMPO|nr:N-acetyltransferase 9-like protein isoform X1 [Limulus polyphemus]
MKVNEKIAIWGTKIILVPYKIYHVEKYHQWMKDQELQELTASEPLTLEQEYEMQQSWLEDDDKCTFIVLDKEDMKQKSELDSMIGDVNLFLNNPENLKQGEVEVMIAEECKRGQGKGKEALLFMLRYGIEQLQVTSFIAKVKMKNLASKNMFERIGFKEISQSDIFEELTLQLVVTEEWLSWLLSQTKCYHIHVY